MSRKPVRVLDGPPLPWAEADKFLSDVEIYAIQALNAGKASEGQQKIALNAIVERIAATYERSFAPGGPEGARASDFAEGKRHVGNQIVRLTKLVIKQKT